MKLDHNMLMDFARDEMRNRVRDRKDSEQVHLSKCWSQAFIRAVAKDYGKLMVLTPEGQLIEVEDV